MEEKGEDPSLKDRDWGAGRQSGDWRSRERDFSLRRPTRSQERTRKKKRRPAPFEMTVVGCANEVYYFRMADEPEVL